jgi:hypothetical protein
MSAASHILGVVLLAVLAGCSSQGTRHEGDASADASPGEAASDAASDAPSDEDCGALAWAGDGCAACTAANCCAVQALCAAIPECTPLSRCWEGCGADAGCSKACGSTYIGAISNFNAVLNCQSQSCASQCAN